MNTAFIFPGQGSQIVGMGKEFYDNFKIARETFDIVDEVLQHKLKDIIFNGPLDKLTLTINAQPALMAVSMAIINVIKEQTKKNIDELCSYVAGHSLGEYTALCAAGSISLEDTAKLLNVRSRSMQEACVEGEGAMAACININLKELEQIVEEVSEFGVCQIANDNIVGQIVVSGKVLAVEKVISIVKDLGYKAIKLKVSAPFHCSLMKPSEEKMQIALNQTVINKPLIPVIQNFTAQPVTDINQIKQNLILQICGRVRWRETLEQLNKLQVTNIVEIGAGNILINMLKKTNYPFKLSNISNLEELQNFLVTSDL
ncbi:ACP S-malonyltransferase [Rickettsia endosymbiont of Ceutorhynchus obstrictus]|uniref:ACP S-malonyltransferase n=1 Tax=Rickettsia endosymbiont of Ceutorhynchus obstrictus TaxID=3066249 RepID=UPI003132F7D3